MILLAVLAALAQPSPAPADEQSTLVRERRSIAIQPEIATAIIPYFRCLMDAFNEEGDRIDIISAAAARAAQQNALARCTAARGEARSAAVVMLARSNAVSGDREAFVERALASIDHVHDHIADRFEQMKQSGQESAGTPKAQARSDR